MKPLLDNPKIGDEFYKIRNGHTIGYYKCLITNVYKNTKDEFYQIEYYIKGKNTKHLKRFKNVNIIAYRTQFFQNKINMLLYIDKIKNKINRKITPQVKIELESQKKKYPQYFIWY